MGGGGGGVSNNSRITLDLLPRLDADLLNAGPLVAQDDGPLPRPLHPDRAVDLPLIGPLAPTLNLHGQLVGELIAQAARQLFPNQFRHEEAFGAIGEGVGLVMVRPRRQVAPEHGEQARHVLPPASHDGHKVCPVVARRRLREVGQ